MKLFQMKLKVEHFHVYDLVTVCFEYASEILRTRYREPVRPIFGLKNVVGKSLWSVLVVEEIQLQSRSRPQPPLLNTP
jgi:hypothetical protein